MLYIIFLEGKMGKKILEPNIHPTIKYVELK
jgi:hypothetical protein